ncbi:MAG: phage Gp37/Gp68 family protein [Acidobacteriota bacterium]|nr:phage Gp37/Gp68 family protein [Acidobacteriota bacterium]
MAEKSTIEWTDATWNPVTGCAKISKGCANCYAERLAERFRGVKGHPYEQGFDLRLWHSRLEQPFQWKRPRLIFVNSMSDLFHKDVPIDFISTVFDTMEKADWHVYQILSKRSDLMRDFVNERYHNQQPPSHIWLGVSVEDSTVVQRVENLRRTKAALRFLSIEPLLGPIRNINLIGIHWVIVGGESGPGHRPIKPEWVREIRNQCIESDVAFFFKQWGGTRPKSGGNILDGSVWYEFPKLPTDMVAVS